MEKPKGRPRRRRLALNRGYPFSFISPHTIDLCVGRLKATPAYKFDPYIVPNFDRVVVKHRDADHYVFRLQREKGRLYIVEVQGILARVGQETHGTCRARIDWSTLIFILFLLIVGLITAFSNGDPDGRMVIGTLVAALVWYSVADSARYRFYEDVIKMFDGREQVQEDTDQKKHVD